MTGRENARCLLVFLSTVWELFRVFEKSPKICYEHSIPPEEFLGPSSPKLETELKASFRDLPAPGPQEFKSESTKIQKSGRINSSLVGARAMTTKFLDTKNFTSKILLS